MPMQDMTIQDLRAQIDAVDDQMHDLLMQRAGLVEQIGRLKAQQQETVPESEICLNEEQTAAFGLCAAPAAGSRNYAPFVAAS